MKGKFYALWIISQESNIVMVKFYYLLHRRHLRYVNSDFWAGSCMWDFGTLGRDTGWRYKSGSYQQGFPSGSDGKESTCNAGDPGSIPGSGRSPGGGSGNPLQYSCLENSMDRGAWWAIVHEVADTTEQLTHTHTHTHTHPSKLFQPLSPNSKPISHFKIFLTAAPHFLTM